MSRGQDNEIDQAIIRIRPDLSGFRRELERDLNKQLAGVRGKIPVELDSPIADFQKGANYVAGLRLKYNKQQDAANLKQIRGVRERFELEQSGIRATQKAAKKASDAEEAALDQRFRQYGRQFDLQRAGDQATRKAADERRKAFEKDQAALTKGAERFRKTQAEQRVTRQHKDEQYLSFQTKIDTELTRMAQGRADDEITIRHETENSIAKIGREASRLRIAVLAAEEKAEKETLARNEKAEKASLARRAAQNKNIAGLSKTQKFIDYGGEGVRPMNLLYGVVTAMTPALFAMGASAVQASTSVAALGSAGIGAALGLSGVLVAFQGIGDLLSLRKQVQNEETAGAANAARTATELAQARRSLADAQRDEKTAAAAVHDARREAVRDLEDLRQAVRDLNNEYKSNQLSVKEAERDERATNANFFATALDRARAHQDTLDARTRLADTALQRKRKQEDLKRSIVKGVEGSDKVTAARERARDAADSTANARDTLSRTGGAMSKTSTAAAQLEKKLREMAPAARDMYEWFDKNEELFKRLQRGIAQQVLPGFNKFLNAVTAAPKGGKSTLQVAAEYAGDLGAVISKYAGLFGVFTQSKLFRGSMARIQTTNAKAFDLLGTALLKLADPITRILDKAAPGFLQLADAIERMTDRFAEFIRKADEDGGLAKWFEDSRREAKKWFDIAGNILELLKNLFTGSLGTGGSLVTDFQKFTQSLADWSGSDKGQKQIGDFFDKFRTLPYARIGDFFKNAVIFFAAFRTLSFLKNLNPIVALISTLAASNPGATADLISEVADGITGVLEYMTDHPTQTAALVGILAAAKLGKTIGFDFKIPALESIRNALTSKFKVLDKFVGGGATTGTMNVQAAVVNIYGGTGTMPGTPGKPGAPGTVIPGTTEPGSKKKPGRLAAGGVANLALSAGLGLGAALVGEIDTTGSTPFKKGVQGAVEGTLNGAALGLMVGGPVGAAVGGAIGAAVGTALASWQIKQEQLSTAAGREKFFHDRIDQDVYQAKRYKNRVPLTLANVSRRPGLQEYITSRQQSVDAAVEAMRATGDEKGAVALRIQETRKSATELSRIVQLYGIGKDKADNWARAQVGVDKLVYDQAVAAQNELQNTINRLGDVGAKAQTVGKQVVTLAGQLDTLTGERVIVLTVDGVPKVIDDLTNIAVYQQLIRTGKDPTTANVKEFKRQFDKQTYDGNAPFPAKGTHGGVDKATGGIIPGHSPHPAADDIPAWLTAGEYVHPVSSVKHYGTDFMEAVRDRRYPRYAKGGTVQKWPFTVGIPKEATTTAVTPPGGYGTPGGGTASGSVDVAEIAESTARAMGATSKQLVALIAAGLVESGMRNIDYGDRDSVGFLQQRPSQGWGSVKQLLNPAYATRKFINAAKRMDRPDLTAGQLAANVQRPRADLRYKYGVREGDAAAILNRFAPYLTGAAGGGPTVGGNGTKGGLVAFGRWLQARNYDVTEHPLFGGVHGGHVKNSQHYRASAIDVNKGAGTSAREQSFLRAIIPEAHRRGFRSLFMVPGHYNHAHFDLGQGHAAGGLVPRRYDSGGTLPPGYSLAFNGTGKNETIRTDKQERRLQDGPVRLDRRDLVLLAQAVTAGGTAVNMDGRKVAELTNRYNYLSAGV